ncbi:MAG: NAD(P)H-dependent oxidoreductase [Acidimicrobiia bacterium]
MNVLVAFCHPVPDSFGACLRDATVASLGAHETEVIDLYEGRDLPRGFTDEDAATLAWANAVILIYPTWWASLPAPLMGWVEAGLDRDGWSHLRRVVAITTHGSSRLVNVLTGGVGRRIVRRGLPRLMATGAYGRFIPLFGMDTIDDTTRHEFLESLPPALTRALR